MLTRLKFTNFKSWAQADMPCGRVTGIFGTNSSGKTSLIQYLLLLKQTKDATDRNLTLALNGDLVNLGTIKDAIHRHDETVDIRGTVAFRLDNELSLTDASEKRSALVAKGDQLKVRTRTVIRNRAPSADGLRYFLNDADFWLKRKKPESSEFQLLAQVPSNNNNEFRFVRTPGRAWQLPGPVKSYAFPDQARTYFQNASFLADLEAAYEAALDHMYYLGPLREIPQRDYLWARSRPSDVGRRGEKAIDAILAATEAEEKRNLGKKTRLMPFQEMIAHWLR